MATVLVVDDERDVRAIMSRFLQEGGFAVLEASDGVEAWAMLRRDGGEIQLVLTDVVMPGMPGTELAARLQQFFPQIPAILVSAYTPDELRSRGIGTAFSVLTKPFSEEALLSTVRHVMASNGHGRGG